MRYTLLAVIALPLLVSCGGTIDRRINPDEPDAVGGAVLDSQDIRWMADEMAKDIQASGALMSANPDQRVAFHITRLRNDSSDAIDNEIILTKIRTNLSKSLGRRVKILDRSQESYEEVMKERQAKREGAVTSNPNRTASVAGSDLVLKGTIKDRVKQTGRLKSVYYLVTFELTDLETMELVWTNDYEVKFESEKSVISR